MRWGALVPTKATPAPVHPVPLPMVLKYKLKYKKGCCSATGLLKLPLLKYTERNTINLVNSNYTFLRNLDRLDLILAVTITRIGTLGF